jgi:ATP-dependent helicase HrpB
VRATASDLSLRLEALANLGRFAASHPHEIDRPALRRIADEAARLARLVPKGEGQATLTPAEQAALAYPDRIGRRRPGDAPRFVLAGGKGAVLAAGDPLAATPLLVATDLDGDPREARIRQAIALPEASLRRLFGAEIVWHNECHWSRRDGRVVARQQERFGALVLADRPWPDAPRAAMALGALEAVRDLGLEALGWSDAAQRFRARVRLLAGQGCDLPDMSDAGLLAGLETWLLPRVEGCRTAADLRGLDPLAALQAALNPSQRQMLDRLAPASFTTPLGRQVPIDYSGQSPAAEVRLQELFGLSRHPTVGPDALPLRLTLLSPGNKPVQVTMDLPGFWASSYADVRRDMRGRYPRHPWPDNPLEAAPTLRAKPRGT